MKNLVRLFPAVFFTWTSVSFAFEIPSADCPDGRCRGHVFDVLHCQNGKNCGEFQQLKSDPDEPTWCGFTVTSAKTGLDQGSLAIQYGIGNCRSTHQSVYRCIGRTCELSESPDSGAPTQLIIDPNGARLTLVESSGRSSSYVATRKFFDVVKVRWDEAEPSGSRPVTIRDAERETEIFYLNSQGERIPGVIYSHVARHDGEVSIEGRKRALSEAFSITTRASWNVDWWRRSFATPEDVGTIVMDCDGKAIGVIVGFDSEFTYLLPWSPIVPSSKNPRRIP